MEEEDVKEKGLATFYLENSLSKNVKFLMSRISDTLDINKSQIKNMSLLCVKTNQKEIKNITSFFDINNHESSVEIVVEVLQFGEIQLVGNLKYKGNFKKGKPSGKGFIFNEREDIIWQGEFNKGEKWNGKGICRWIDETNVEWIYHGFNFNFIFIFEYILIGDLKHGNPHGYGKKISLDGNEVIWEGEFNQGKEFNGNGTFHWVDQKKNTWICEGPNFNLIFLF